MHVYVGGRPCIAKINVYCRRDLEQVMDEMQKRVLEIAAYICEENATVRYTNAFIIFYMGESIYDDQ